MVDADQRSTIRIVVENIAGQPGLDESGSREIVTNGPLNRGLRLTV